MSPSLFTSPDTDLCGLEDDAYIGKRLVSVATRSSQLADECKISIFAILRAEMSILQEGENRQRQLDLMIAAFVVFHGTCSDVGESICQPFVQAAHHHQLVEI